MQAQLWSKIYESSSVQKTNDESLKSEFLISINIYDDDFDCSKLEGSHAGSQKFCAGYANLLAFPQYVSLHLRNVLVSLIYKSADG